MAHLGRIPPVQQERRPPARPVQPERQGAYGQVHGAATQVARVRDQGAQAGRAAAEPRGRVFVRGRLAGVDAVEIAAAGERQPGRSRGEPGSEPVSELSLGQPVGGAVLEHRRGGQVPQRVRVAKVAGPVRPLRQQRRRGVAEGGEGGRRGQRGRRRAGGRRLSLRRGELQSDVQQRDGLGGLPSGGSQQRGSGDPAVGRVVPGRVDRQAVAMFGKVRPDPQPVTLAGGQRPDSWHPEKRRRHRPSRRDRSDASTPAGSNSARSFLKSASRGYISASTSAGTRESLAR